MLARGVEKMKFEFWDVRKREWIDDWSQTNALPPMVKFTIEFGDPDRKFDYSAPHDLVGRIVKLPTVTVPAFWQTPNAPGAAPPDPNGNLNNNSTRNLNTIRPGRNSL